MCCQCAGFCLHPNRPAGPALGSHEPRVNDGEVAAWMGHTMAGERRLEARGPEPVSVRALLRSSANRITPSPSSPVSISSVSISVYLYRYLYQEVYFKECAHVILGAGKSEIPRAAWQAGSTGRIYAAASRHNFSRKPPSLLVWPSTDWTRPTAHTLVGVLYSGQLIVDVSHSASPWQHPGQRWAGSPGTLAWPVATDKGLHSIQWDWGRTALVPDSHGRFPPDRRAGLLTSQEN